MKRQAPHSEKQPAAAAPDDKWLKASLAILLLFFLCRVSGWACGEFWYDETLSLTHFVLGRTSPWSIFRTYPIANNHILSNALEWIWLALGGGGPGFTETLVRIPALAASLATLLLIALGWRRFLGARGALLAAALMAASPLFGGFAWQMRGYALAIALSTALVGLGASRLRQPTRRNALGCFATALLLPLTMPSAAMLPFAVLLAMAVCTLRQKTSSDRRGIGRAIRLVGPGALGVLLGCGYYGTLWQSFVYASHEAGGWPSFWMTLGGILLPFLLHVLMALLLCLLPLQGTDADAACEALAAPAEDYAVALAGACAAAVMAILLLRMPEGRFPFPRVFLPLLPAVTFSATTLLVRLKNAALTSQRTFLTALTAIILFGTAAGMAGDWWNVRSLRRGATRQNLLAQYYRGMDDNQRLAARLTESHRKAGRPFLLIVPSMDAPTAQFYLALYGGDSKTWGIAVAPERLQDALVQEAVQHRAQILVSARNADEARTLADAYGTLTGGSGHLEPLFTTDFRQVWNVVGE